LGFVGLVGKGGHQVAVHPGNSSQKYRRRPHIASEAEIS
jgi:hypothetical protein